MKCITKAEMKTLLREQGVQYSGGENIEFPTNGYGKLMVSVPEKTKDLRHFTRAIIDWLPAGKECCLYEAYWETEPARDYRFFDKIRSGYGDKRPLIEAPAQLFDIKNDDDHAAMTNMVFLSITFDWNAFCFTQGSNDHVYMSDGFVAFLSNDIKKLDAAEKVARNFKLKRIERWPHP